MCKPTDLKRGKKRQADDEIDCEIVTSPDLLQDTNQTNEEEEEANLTEEQSERRAYNRLTSVRTRSDQLARLQATVDHQSTRVAQLEQTNNALMGQIRILTENRNRLLQMVEAAKNGLHPDLPGATASFPRMVAAPPPPPAMSPDAFFLLNHVQGASTLSPVGFQGTSYLLATLRAMSERNNVSQQPQTSEQTSADFPTGMLSQYEQQLLVALLQRRRHQADVAAACDFLGNRNLNGPNNI